MNTVANRVAVLIFWLATSLTLAACQRQQAPVVFTPLRYDYLPPLELNVASVTVDQQYVPADGLTPLDPAQPTQALQQMAQDRLRPAGSSGRAVFVIKDAAIARLGDTLSGQLAVELGIYSSDGTRTAFAEARVARQRTLGDQDLRTALYELTRQMMEALNVEFEYQVRHSLQDWLITPKPAVPAPVEQQALPPAT
ncbi:MAG: hypothetical protein JOY71_05165 [Acetobacteraceae bacterium]|nr:hypothetical protein [Acetobacteraceae bacterium]MBV8521511.1 hypothetical protein [Acetobacteraceae bacterium]